MAGATRFDYRLTAFWEQPGQDNEYAINRGISRRHPLFLNGEWMRGSEALPTDRRYGAGSLNMLSAYDILDAGEFDAEGTVPIGVRGWDYAQRLAVGDSVTYPMSIARESMFSAVLVWHRYVDDRIVSHLPDYELSVYDVNGARVALSDSTTSNVELVETKLAPGTYQMKVRVKSDGGSTDGLSYGLAWTTKEVLAQPTSVAVAKSGRNWTVSWDRQANRKYRVVVARDAAHTDVVKEVYRPRSGIASDAASYAYSIPADRTPRYFRVYAYPEDGRVAYEYPSEPVEVRSLAPGLVTGLVATANGAEAITLSWSAPEYGGSTSITGYWIEWSADGESDWYPLRTTVGTATRFTHRGLGVESTHHYRVSAINAAGKGPASAPASATTDRWTGYTPGITSASTFEVAEGTTAVATLAATDVDTAVADLEWSIPLDAAGGADRGRFSLTTGGVLSFTAEKDFEAPDDAGSDGSYQVTVRVSDSDNTDTADLTVTLTNVNEAPMANAGEDLSGIEPGSLVTLDGSGEDPDAGDSLTFLWSQTAGDSVTLAATAARRPTFTAPDNLAESEELTFTLWVSDAAGLAHADSVSVTVLPNRPPLTASFENVPETHDGSMAFTLRLRFSEDVRLSDRAFATGLFSITNGTIGQASRVTPGSSIAWDF
ncbi:MAG: fibronectin type III domain-containing protein, partial [Gammaproteobacteria bacterium]|nr:fibronectin type III domain-containing protein [Gammaproteobacteria bacterium]